MHLFFSVGEPSGDEHASELMHELCTRHGSAVQTGRAGGFRASGFGGPKMLAAGQEQHFALCNLAVMGIGQILPQLKTFFRLADEAEAFFRTERPDAVVLIDYPGFNWHIARRAKKHGIPVVYYMPPQLWAWAPWRIRKARRLVDLVLSGLPFEAEWYRGRGVATAEVSHPFFDEVARRRLDESLVSEIRRSGRPLAILPGSRNSEVQKNVPVQLSVARRLAARHPDLRFHVACYKPAHAEAIARLVAKEAAGLPITLHVGKLSEVVEASDAVCAVSGSVSLELLARRKPTSILYRGSPLMWAAGHTLITVPFFTLPNLIAGREVMPEHPFVRRIDRHAAAIAADLHAWLDDDVAYAAKVSELEAVAQSVVQPGGTAAACDALESFLGTSRGRQATGRAAA